MDKAAKPDSLPSDLELHAMTLREPGRVHCDGVRVQAMAREILRMRRDAERLRTQVEQMQRDMPSAFGGTYPSGTRFVYAVKDVSIGRCISAWAKSEQQLEDDVGATLRHILGKQPKQPKEPNQQEHNDDQMALDTFLRRCGVDMTRAEGLPLLHWLRAAAECVKGVSSLPAETQTLDPIQAAKRKRIVGELREVINRYSLERAGGDTPDHILAEAMFDTLLAFGERVQKRDGEPRGQRAALGGQVPASTTFEDWLGTQTQAEQNIVLGRAKAEAWRAGKLSLADMLGRDLQPLSLAELKELDRL